MNGEDIGSDEDDRDDVDRDPDDVDVDADAPPRSVRDWLNWLRRTIFG